MINRKNLIFLVLFGFALTGCEKEPITNDYWPEAGFIIEPNTGNTTTLFHFDASSTFENNLEDNPVFIRWDWNSDGVWDNAFNSKTQESFRFYEKGTYTISLEASTLLGKRDTATITLNISQGYSPPRASVVVSPDTANIYTGFLFDASGTCDDEDSLDQLLFRWDFNGDDHWDTEYIQDYIQMVYFPKSRFYRTRVEVKDPQGMTAQISCDVIVNLVSDSIKSLIGYECGFCTPEDTVIFDASRSYKYGDESAGLRYSWDVYNDRNWEVEDNYSPIFDFHFPDTGLYQVKLRVTDHNDLYRDTITKVKVYPVNTPPVAVLVLGNRYGNTSTEYYLHALNSSDREDGFFDRKVDWDLNDDGMWDPELEGLHEITTTYGSTGEYPVALKITDTNGKVSIAYDTIMVYPGNRQTDILADARASYIPEYYGIVKVGNTWWTQNNSRFYPPNDNTVRYTPDVYREEIDSVFKYGYLYPYEALDDYVSPCPDGWRIPTINDWKNLMEDLGGNVKVADLLPGGASELHIHLTGYFASGGYKAKGRMVNYYTPDTTTQGHPRLWYIDKLLNQNHDVIANKALRLPVRCVK